MRGLVGNELQQHEAQPAMAEHPARAAAAPAAQPATATGEAVVVFAARGVAMVRVVRGVVGVAHGVVLLDRV
ncbi:hypothetical protein D9M72_243580 [compost metagenome]